MKAPRKQAPREKRFRFQLEYAFLRSLEWLLPKFSRRLLQRCGHGLGWCAFYLWPRVRRISRQNLDVAYGNKLSQAEKTRVARAALQNNAAALFTMFWASRLTVENYKQYIEIDEPSLQLFKDLEVRGKGVVSITAHFGDWEILGLATGFFGLKLTVVQEAMSNERLEGIFARLRSVSGNRLIPNHYVAMTLLKTLKRGGIIALLSDQNGTRKRRGIWLNYFGVPAYCNSAPGLLAMHTGASIIGAASYPLPDGRVRLVYGPEIKYERTGDDEADSRLINQQCLDFCEQIVRERPELWMWSYKRWAYRMSPELGPYPAYSRHVPFLTPVDGLPARGDDRSAG